MTGAPVTKAWFEATSAAKTSPLSIPIRTLKPTSSSPDSASLSAAIEA
jgi:hypothetical protein